MALTAALTDLLLQEHDHAPAGAKLPSYNPAELSDNRGRDAETPWGKCSRLLGSACCRSRHWLGMPSSAGLIGL